ncbi:10618_t:CDS:1, partial [Entrophospora sp. SA101]
MFKNEVEEEEGEDFDDEVEDFATSSLHSSLSSPFPSPAFIL